MPPQRLARPGEINGDFVDRYTLGHVAFGVLMGLGRLPWWAAVGVAAAWELSEDAIKDAAPQFFPNPTHDTRANAVVDFTSTMVGYGATKLFPPMPKVK